MCYAFPWQLFLAWYLLNAVKIMSRRKKKRKKKKRKRLTMSHFISRTSINWYLLFTGVYSMRTLLRKLVTLYPFNFIISVRSWKRLRQSWRMGLITFYRCWNQFSPGTGLYLTGRPLKAPLMSRREKTKISKLGQWVLVNWLSWDLWTAWQGQYLQSVRQKIQMDNYN